MSASVPVRLDAASLAKRTVLLLVRAYKIFLSPFLGGACKFYPSCSNYAYEAVARHGARRGTWLAVKRLLRCRPLTHGGFDPVPEFYPGTHGPADSACVGKGVL
jgi:putative membrane protein insertion efficiency factor